MSSMQVTDIITPEAPTPFLNFKAGSSSHTWEGLFAFNYQVDAVPPELMPTAVYPIENIVLHVAGTTQHLSLSQDKNWQKGVSVPGRLCFYPRNRLIKTYWNNPGEFVAFGVAKERFGEVAAEVRRGDPENIELQGFGIFDDPLLTQIGWTLFGLLNDESVSARLYAESLGVTLAHHLLRYYAPEAPNMALKTPSALLPRQIKIALDYIHIHYTRNVSLSEIAGAAGLSVAHFTRLFRQATQYTPYEYLIRYRVERAYKLFQQRKYSGAEIAQLVGFYDESHLLRYFKRIYGVTPSKLFH